MRKCVTMSPDITARSIPLLGVRQAVITVIVSAVARHQSLSAIKLLSLVCHIPLSIGLLLGRRKLFFVFAKHLTASPTNASAAARTLTLCMLIQQSQLSGHKARLDGAAHRDGGRGRPQSPATAVPTPAAGAARPIRAPPRGGHARDPICRRSRARGARCGTAANPAPSGGRGGGGRCQWRCDGTRAAAAAGEVQLCHHRGRDDCERGGGSDPADAAGRGYLATE